MLYVFARLPIGRTQIELIGFIARIVALEIVVEGIAGGPCLHQNHIGLIQIGKGKGRGTRIARCRESRGQAGYGSQRAAGGCQRASGGIAAAGTEGPGGIVNQVILPAGKCRELPARGQGIGDGDHPKADRVGCCILHIGCYIFKVHAGGIHIEAENHLFVAVVEALRHIDGAVVGVDAGNAGGMVVAHLGAAQQLFGENLVVVGNTTGGLGPVYGAFVKLRVVVHPLVLIVPGNDIGVKHLALKDNLVASRVSQVCDLQQRRNGLSTLLQRNGIYGEMIVRVAVNEFDKFLAVVAGDVVRPDREAGRPPHCTGNVAVGGILIVHKKVVDLEACGVLILQINVDGPGDLMGGHISGVLRTALGKSVVPYAHAGVAGGGAAGGSAAAAPAYGGLIVVGFCRNGSVVVVHFGHKLQPADIVDVANFAANLIFSAGRRYRACPSGAGHVHPVAIDLCGIRSVRI